MKNKDKAEKLGKILEENIAGDLLIDMFILQNIQGQIEDITDKKLKIKLEGFIEEIAKDFSERDLEEERKIEFYCSRCHKFLPISKKAPGHYVDMCCKCSMEEAEENQEAEDF